MVSPWRGLTVREDYAPFAPVFISTTVTEESSIGGTLGGLNEAQDVGSDQRRRRRAPPQVTPPWQTPPGGPEEAGAPTNPQSRRESETHREAGARDAGSSNWSKGGKGYGGSYSGKGSRSTLVAHSEVGSQRQEAKASAGLGREAKVPAYGKRVRPETKPEGRAASDRSRSERSRVRVSDDELKRLIEEMERIRAGIGEYGKGSPR